MTEIIEGFPIGTSSIFFPFIGCVILPNEWRDYILSTLPEGTLIRNGQFLYHLCGGHLEPVTVENMRAYIGSIEE